MVILSVVPLYTGTGGYAHPIIGGAALELIGPVVAGRGNPSLAILES
jgi:hypothetical protein